MFDVIIIGASPAGLQVAKECSDDLDVLILEKRESFKNNRFPDTSFFGFFDFLGFETNEKYIKNKVEGMEIISPYDNSLKIHEKGFSIDRTQFSNYYLEKAQNNGAEIWFDSEVIDIKKNRVILSDQSSLEAKVIVYAGGTHSKLNEKLQMKSMKYPNDLASAIQAYVEKVDLSENYFRYFMGKNIAPGWKASINPMGNNIYSVGVFVRDFSPKKYFDRFMEKKIFRDAEILEIGEGHDQIITIPNELVKENKLIVGGAAGQAGIPFAMKAGEICGQIISESFENGYLDLNNLKSYEKKWKKNYNKFYKLGRFSLKTIEKMKDKDLDKAIRSLQGEEISHILDKYNSNSLKIIILASKMFKNDPTIFKLIKYLF